MMKVMQMKWSTILLQQVDLIATGYEEAPVDHEKHNQLHQKWLEQQDAAGTNDILQRLKYGKKTERTYLSP